MFSGSSERRNSTSVLQKETDAEDRFLLGFHATAEDMWLLLLEKLTVVEANDLKTAMTMATIVAKDPLQQSLDLNTAKGRDFFLTQTILGGECTAAMFIECYLKAVSSVSFQRHRAELLYRLNKVYELYDVDKVKRGALRFRDFPALRKAINGVDYAERKPPVTSYTERPMFIHGTEFAPAAWEENGDAVTEEGDVIPPNLQVFALNECSNLQFHPHLARYSFSIHDALMLATIEWRTQTLLIHRVLHGRHRAPVTTSVHVPQTRTFYTTSADRTVCGWLADERFAQGGKSRLPSAATCIAYDPVSQMLVTGATDGCVYLLPVIPKLAAAVRKVQAHSDWCMGIVPLPDLEQVATCGLDGTVKIWTSLFDLRTTKKIRDSSKDEEGRAKSPMRNSRPRDTSFEFRPPSKASSAPTVNGGGLTHMSFSASQKMIFAVEGGRSVNCWNVFLPSPSDVLRFHEKPVVGTVGFRDSQEFITADTSGRIAVWDMHRALTTQRLGGPESEFPCGTINSIAYDPHRGSIAALGARLCMFVPEQGTFSPLFELPVVRVHYAKVSRTIIVPTGNRVVVLDLISSSTRAAMSIGTEEIASSALAAREHILVGTTEGSIFYSPLTHWRPTTIAKLDDSVVAVYDLGPNSRAGAQGEENSRVLAVTRTGNISHMAFGYSGNEQYARAPPKHFKFLAIDLINLTAFSRSQFIVFGTMGSHLEAWDLTFTYQKTSERLDAPITAMTCIDEINGLVLALADNTIRVYNAASVIPIASVTPSLASPAAGADAIRQLVFNSNTCTIAVMREATVRCFSCERLVQGLQRSQHDAPFTPTNAFVLLPNDEADAFFKAGPPASAGMQNVGDKVFDNTAKASSQSIGTVRSLRNLIQRLNEEDEDEEELRIHHTLSADLSTLAGDDKPMTFACQWRTKDQTIVVCEMDGSYIAQCIARLANLRRWWHQQVAAPVAMALAGPPRRLSLHDGPQPILKASADNAAPNTRSSLIGAEALANNRNPSIAFDTSMTASFAGPPGGGGSSTVAKGGLISIAESFIILPNYIHVPIRNDEQLLEGMLRQAVYTICDPMPRRGAIVALEQSTWNHRTPLGLHTLESLKWLAISVASALHAIHNSGHVALFSQGSIRYVCPNYKICLEAGLWRFVPAPEPAREDAVSDSSNASLSSPPLLDSTIRSLGATARGVAPGIPKKVYGATPTALPQTPSSKALDDAKRQIPDMHVPPEGVKGVLPSIDMWLLGLALFRACSGRSYELGAAGTEGPAALAQVFDRHAAFIHPSVRHDVLLMVMLRGLLEPDPAKRMTSIDLLLTASQYGEGIRRVVRTLGEAEAVVVGATVLDEVQLSNDTRRQKANDSIVTFDQQLPSIIFSERTRRRSHRLLNMNMQVEDEGEEGDDGEDVADNVTPNTIHGDITLLQFAPPAHLRLPSVPNPMQLGTTRRVLAEVPYDDLAVRKVGIEEDLRRDRQPSNAFAPTRGGRESVTGTAMSLIRNNSGFCKPANDSLASGPIHYYPVLGKGQFTHAIFIDSLQLFLIAEFDRSVGASGCSYISLRRNLSAASFAQALGEYYRKKATVGSVKQTSMSQFRRYDPGPDKASPFATLVVAIYPPNNGVQCLGGVESSDVEAAVTKRAGAGSVAAADKKDARTVESEKRLQDRAFEDSGASSTDSGSEDDDAEDGGRKKKLRKPIASMTARERKEHFDRKAGRLERKTQALAKEEAMRSVQATMDIDEEFMKIQKQAQYKPERMCPFFTESQATAEAMGVVSTVPPPDLFYMKGWHRNRPMSRLREGKTADPQAYQPRSTSVPLSNRPPLGGGERTRFPALASPVRDHSQPVRAPISLRAGGDDLLCVTKSSTRRHKK